MGEWTHGNIPYRDWDSAMADITGLEARVYIVLCMHANPKFESRPSLQRLASALGCKSHSTIRRALENLQSKGFITRTGRGCGRGRPAVYRLEKGAPAGAPFRSIKVRLGATERCASGRAPKSIEEHKKKGAPTPAATSPADSPPLRLAGGPPASGARGDGKREENRAALEASGVGEPTQSQLAGLPWLTPEIIAEFAAEASGGLLVHKIREDGQKLAQNLSNARAFDDRSDAQSKAYKEDTEHATTEREEVKRLLDGLSDKQIAELKEAALASMSSGMASTWRNLDPRHSLWLGSQVARIARSRSAAS